MTGRRETVTRFAPSPTGYLHIGGARTALFNWLYARHTRGRFLLRIEDTDRARSTQDAVNAIIDGLNWLGLHADGDPVYQFARASRHAEVAHSLVEQGKAFRCYVTPEELDARRLAAEAARKALADARKADAPPSEIAKLHAEAEALSAAFRSPYRDGGSPPSADAPFVVRIRAPDEGSTVIEDRVQGRVTWANRDLDDLVLLRSDGTPTYMLSVVVDDHDMAVTHVIRGDDHLTNAARQKLIFDAAGWETPAFAHIPLIHGSDGAKLSKRHGALGVEAYRAMGYLPEAVLNYLARLGWSHGDDEIFTMDQAAAWFDLDAINKAPSRLDLAKLENLNGHYIRHTADADLVRACRELVPHLEDGAAIAPLNHERGWTAFAAAMPGLKERAKTLTELLRSGHFLFASRPIPLDQKAAKLLDAAGKAHIAALLARLKNAEWTRDALEAAAKAYAAEANEKLGAIMQPVRAALTGTTVSPSVFDIAIALGREETLGRLADQAA
jgi:glutamyl-tRNA synthetase